MVLYLPILEIREQFINVYVKTRTDICQIVDGNLIIAIASGQKFSKGKIRIREFTINVIVIVGANKVTLKVQFKTFLYFIKRKEHKTCTEFSNKHRPCCIRYIYILMVSYSHSQGNRFLFFNFTFFLIQLYVFFWNFPNICKRLLF